MTFAGTSSNGQDAPKPDLPAARSGFGTTQSGLPVSVVRKPVFTASATLEDRGGSLRAPISACLGGDDVELPGRYQPVVPHDRQCQLGREGIVHPSKILGQ